MLSTEPPRTAGSKGKNMQNGGSGGGGGVCACVGVEEVITDAPEREWEAYLPAQGCGAHDVAHPALGARRTQPRVLHAALSSALCTKHILRGGIDVASELSPCYRLCRALLPNPVRRLIVEGGLICSGTRALTFRAHIDDIRVML